MERPNRTLILTNLQLNQTGAYSVMVSNAFGTLGSSTAELTVLPAVITAQPQDAVTFIGGTTGFSVAAQGEEPLFYQWQLNGTDLEGATNSSLTLTNVQRTQSGAIYSVTISNHFGIVASRNAVLSVVRVAAWG